MKKLKPSQILLIIIGIIGLILLFGKGSFLASIVTTCENNEPISIGELTTFAIDHGTTFDLANTATIRAGGSQRCCKLTALDATASTYSVSNTICEVVTETDTVEDVDRAECEANDKVVLDYEPVTTDFYSMNLADIGIISAAKVHSCSDVLESEDDFYCETQTDIRCSYGSIESFAVVNALEKYFLQINGDYYWCGQDGTLVYKAPDYLTASKWITSQRVCIQTLGPDLVTNATACEEKYGTMNTAGFCECDNGDLVEADKVCAEYLRNEATCTLLQGTWNSTTEFCMCDDERLITGEYCGTAPLRNNLTNNTLNNTLNNNTGTQGNTPPGTQGNTLPGTQGNTPPPPPETDYSSLLWIGVLVAGGMLFFKKGGKKK